MLGLLTENDKTAVVKFLEQKNFSNLLGLGKGGYADVLAAQTPKDEKVAVKIIKDVVSWRVEEQIWPLLDHKNILPVIEVFEMPENTLKMYVSPRQPSVLDRLATSREFRSDAHGLDRIRKWFKEILSGLQYLHTAGFAHMDLKSDNILISEDDSAVICDFSGLAIIEMKTKRLCSPLAFRPPECSTEAGVREGVDCVPYDMWTFGLMALNVLTGHWPQNNLPYTENVSWDRDVRPVLLNTFEIPNFYAFMSRALPGVTLSVREIEQARSFILSLMRLSPGERPSAKQALEHPFLADLNCISHDILIVTQEGNEVKCDEEMNTPPTTDIEQQIGDNVSSGQTFENETRNINERGDTLEFITECKAVYDEENSVYINKNSDSNLLSVQAVDGNISNFYANSGKNYFKMLSTKSFKKECNIQRKHIKAWFHKKWRKMFPKNEYQVLLSTES